MNAVSAPLPLHFVHWGLTLSVEVLLSTLFPIENVLHESGLRRLEGKQATHVLKSETWKTGEGRRNWQLKAEIDHLSYWESLRPVVISARWTESSRVAVYMSQGPDWSGHFWQCSCFKFEVLCLGLLNNTNVWGLGHPSMVFQYAPRMETDTCLQKTSLNYKENLWNLTYILIQTLECKPGESNGVKSWRKNWTKVFAENRGKQSVFKGKKRERQREKYQKRGGKKKYFHFRLKRGNHSKGAGHTL